MNYEYAFKKNALGRTITCCGLILKVCLIVAWNCRTHMPVVVRLACLLAVIVYPTAFLKAALSDPGRLRRKEKCPCGGSMRLSDGVMIKAYPEQYTRDIVVASRDKNTVYRQHLCPTCLIYKPHQTAHCSECDCCLLEKDHHCFWVANCIGRNNFRLFLVFVLWASVIFLLSGCALRDLLSGYWIGSFMPYPLYCFSALLGMFFLYYAGLGAFGLTSREYLNGKKQGFIGWSKLGRNMLSCRPPIVVVTESV